jgi:predicted hydrocarbon binding protein
MVIKEEKEEEKNVGKGKEYLYNIETKEGFIAKTSGRISEFFNHMIAYGGFNVEDGVMKIWGDPSLFVPMEAFITLFYEIENKLGKDTAHDVFYWLGRLTGKNATEMLIKRYGLNRKNIPDFLNGATQDGMGYLRIKDYDNINLTYAIVTSINSTFAIEYSKKYGKTNFPVDYYLGGILAGGIEPLVDQIAHVYEKECMAKGDSQCLYYFEPLTNHPQYDFFKNLNLNEDDILKKARLLMLKRKGKFKIFGKKDIKFGDGTFVFNKIQGMCLMSYAKVIFDQIIKLKINEDKKNIDSKFVDKCLEVIKDRILKKDLRDILKEIEIFGYGKFEIKFSGSKKILISNSNNPYSMDYIEIFGYSKNPVDDFIVILLQKIYELNGKKVNIKETQCIAKRDKFCTFEITFL